MPLFRISFLHHKITNPLSNIPPIVRIILPPILDHLNLRYDFSKVGLPEWEGECLLERFDFETIQNIQNQK